MKTCPSCKAKIDDDARFCLYCMTSLDNKKSVKSAAGRSVWPIILLTAVAMLCIIIAVFAATRSGKDEPVSYDRSDVTTSFSGTSASVRPIVTTTVPTSATTVLSTTTTDTVTTTAATTTTAAVQTPVVKYVYRPVESGDEFIAVGIERPENGITIVDVETPAEDGIYDIPAYIDGCPVLAIEEYAFCRPAVAPTVKTVYFPETMTTVNEFAFSSCVNLSDVYYRGNIYIQGYAYPSPNHRNGPLTVHCAEDCHNRNFRLHKNMVSEEDNTYYEEWNGD